MCSIYGPGSDWAGEKSFGINDTVISQRTGSVASYHGTKELICVNPRFESGLQQPVWCQLPNSS